MTPASTLPMPLPSLLLPLFLILIGVTLQPWGAVDALSCARCKDAEGNYVGYDDEGNPVGVPCTPIPSPEEGCERAFRPCRCCPECAGQAGDECHGMSARCRRELHCVNDKGVAKKTVGWWENFHGVCTDLSTVEPGPSVAFSMTRVRRPGGGGHRRSQFGGYGRGPSRP